MDPLVQLVGSVLSWLRPMVGVNVCPGGWAWTITVFGLLVGLSPACGAVTVAVLRRRAEPSGALRPPRAVPVIAVFSAGLLPWLAFEATGQALRQAGTSTTVFNHSDEVSLAGRTCLGVSQRAYLGSLPVSGALGDGVLRTALFAIPLVIFPGFAVLFVWMQGRLALRRGPRWPSRYFWLSMLVVAVLTGPMPAGTTAQLWAGVVGGAFAGVVVALLVPPPARV
ncbi:MAG: hypothetical protein J2P20_08590, partial [Pseudonocardia sp.]|nr:hypothetical protein [Pseudonocardia sp.]